MKVCTFLFSLLFICFLAVKAQDVSNNSSKQELLQYHLAQLKNDNHAPYRLIVKFSDKVSATDNGKTTNSDKVNNVLSEIQMKAMKPLFEKTIGKNAALKAQFGLQHYYTINLDRKTDLSAALIKLNALDEIEVVEPDYLATTTTVPNDPFYTQQWAMNNTGQAVQWGTNDPIGTVGVDLNMQAVWDIQTGSEDVVVCILDTGVDTDHPEFTGRIVPGYDFQFEDDDPNPIPGEDAGAHGTACAGIVGASGNNGIGVAGIAWHTKIMPVKVLYDNSGAWSIIASGITWAADNGADIISMSLGGTSYSSTLEDAVDYAFNLGSTLLAASGNSNNDIGISPFYPAVFSNTICVGALSPCEERKNPNSCDGEYWWGSNYGSTMDFLTPGTRNYTTDISGSDGYNSGDYNPFFNGTSSACPYAAGIAALMLAENPSLTNAQLRSKMQLSCVDMGVAGKDDDSGYGRIDAFQALMNATNNQTIVRITPLNQTVAPGAYFSIDFMIQNVTNLASYEFNFSYEPDYMDLLDVEFSDFLTSTGRVSVPSVVTPDPNGYIFVSNGTTGLMPAGPDGTERLFTVNFQASETPPDFSTVQFNIIEFELLQPDGTPIVPLIVNNSVIIQPDYCKTDLYNSGCSNGDYFNYVGIANLENANSGCNSNGYGDFSYRTADVIQGQEYALTLQIAAGVHYVSAWIDYNDNFEFEADEKILDDYYYPTAYQFKEVDITIAGDATPGAHRFRLRTVAGSQGADACSLEDFGEVEDYTVNILPQDQFGRIEGFVAAVTYESVPGALIQLQPSGASTLSNSMGYYCVNVEEGTTSITCSASGYDTFYDNIYVSAGEVYNLDIFLWLPDGPCTENLYGTGCWDGDGIEDFFFGDIYHPESGCSPDGYGDFTYMSTSLTCGEYYYVEVSSVYGSNYLNIWIDFNDNLTFEPEERILENEYIDMGGELYYFDVYLPEGCVSGEHLMRARANYGDPFDDPCGWAEWGEVHDYTVYVEGDDAYGTLQGTVYNWDTGLPQANINIEIQELGLSTTSGADGYYVFGSVLSGEYYVSVNQAGYFQTAILANIAPWETSTEDMFAMPIHDNHFQIPQGWSGISSVYYMYQSVSDIFAPHSDDLVIISSMDGFYYPGQNVNTLGRWDNSPGYKIKAQNAINFDFPGWSRQPSTLSLPAGWSFLPAWSDCAVSIEDLFDAAGTQPVIVKEIAGSGVYWPNKSVYSLSELNPGKAYLVLMNNQTTIDFPECALNSSGVSQVSASVNTTTWDTPVPTGNSHLIHVPQNLILHAGLVAGDYIGAFDASGACFGIAQITGLQDHALTAFSDDALTAAKDGFEEGEQISLKAFYTKTGQSDMLDVVFDLQMPNQQYFAADGLSSVILKSTGISSNFSGTQSNFVLSPNPTSGVIHLQSSVEDEIMQVKVFDNQGRQLYESGNLTIGASQPARFDFSGFPSGFYTMKIVSSKAVFEEKFVIK
ncbi:MAG: T9SS type A sorting domain-containing protein [Clostridia bacterium]|nr:T9SS type A sorting domain-containing protein [Clostridia bacterium]